MRSLIIVLGDQLDLDASAFDDFDPATDAVWMAEVVEESTHVWSAKQRIAMFLSAMRHFSEALRNAGRTVQYSRLERGASDGADSGSTLAEQLAAALGEFAPERLVMTAPGDWRVLQAIKSVASGRGVPLDIREDRHFYGTVREFAAYIKAHPRPRLEYFYRDQRRRHGILMNGESPVGNRWNFDAENRETFGAQGPIDLAPRATFPPDDLTREVIAVVEARFGAHPGTLDSFAWPVTRQQALIALNLFVEQRLPNFGRFQDAMWLGEAWGYHAQLSAALNLKLLNPREVVAAALEAYERNAAPLSSVEGFIRQILGWREYVRGIYWTRMPQYLAMNELEGREPLPAWYWTGDTDMTCLKEVIGQTLRTGYAHHIQRLMVTGLYALLLGVTPREVHEWYLAVYVDAVEWAELPNVLGMSQYADGGIMGSKPYIASGKYIDRMSNYCKACRYDPALRDGPTACPFTTLYWEFLMRHETLLENNRRTALQVKNLARLSPQVRDAIHERATAIRRGDVGSA